MGGVVMSGRVKGGGLQRWGGGVRMGSIVISGLLKDGGLQSGVCMSPLTEPAKAVSQVCSDCAGF